MLAVAICATAATAATASTLTALLTFPLGSCIDRRLSHVEQRLFRTGCLFMALTRRTIVPTLAWLAVRTLLTWFTRLARRAILALLLFAIGLLLTRLTRRAFLALTWFTFARLLTTTLLSALFTTFGTIIPFTALIAALGAIAIAFSLVAFLFTALGSGFGFSRRGRGRRLLSEPTENAIDDARARRCRGCTGWQRSARC